MVIWGGEMVKDSQGGDEVIFAQAMPDSRIGNIAKSECILGVQLFGFSHECLGNIETGVIDRTTFAETSAVKGGEKHSVATAQVENTGVSRQFGEERDDLFRQTRSGGAKIETNLVVNSRYFLSIKHR